jgi:glycosyltransferase involved in cell wall biosynthesis
MNSVALYHSILWSKYKGVVFSELYSQSRLAEVNFSFTQIAETAGDRIGLSGVDLSYHKYPFSLLFRGSYDSLSKIRLIISLFKSVWSSSDKLILLPGYHLPEYWAMLFAAKLRRKLVGVFCDSTEFDRPKSTFKGYLKRFFFSSCDVFFGYGERSHNYLRSHGANPRNIYYRCQAAALPLDYDQKDVLIFRRKTARNVDGPVFLYVGRLSSEKGLDTLFNAFAEVLKVLPQARLSIVGSGPERENLYDLATDLEIINSIDFAGSKGPEELRVSYLNASCLVLPSTSEPWGLVVNEALSYGCPVVVSNICGCVPELVLDGKTGFVFNASDKFDLSLKLLRIVNEFEDLESIAKNCLATIEKYSPAAAASQILFGCVETFKKID